MYSFMHSFWNYAYVYVCMYVKSIELKIINTPECVIVL